MLDVPEVIWGKTKFLDIFFSLGHPQQKVWKSQEFSGMDCLKQNMKWLYDTFLLTLYEIIPCCLYIMLLIRNPCAHVNIKNIFVFPVRLAGNTCSLFIHDF